MQADIVETIKNLLRRQQCTGASKNEELLCFKKALKLTLRYNISAISSSLYLHLGLFSPRLEVFIL